VTVTAHAQASPNRRAGSTSTHYDQGDRAKKDLPDDVDRNNFLSCRDTAGSDRRGLIRSMGGWKKVGEPAGSGIRVKGDERFLGDSDFVLDVPDTSTERFERKYQLRSQGVTYNIL